MSSTKKVVIIFTCIFCACVIGIGITLGVFFSGGRRLTRFTDIFGGETFEVNESAVLDLAGIDTLRIDCASADIHIIESDDASAELTGTAVSSNKQRFLSVTNEDGTLNIKVEQEYFLFNIYADFDLKVYLPSDSALSVDIQCASGDTDVTDLTFGALQISKASGDLKIERVGADTLDCDSASGDSVIVSSSFGRSSLSSQSGDTAIRDTSGALTVRTTSGDIDITGADGALDIGCTSGSVTLGIAVKDVPPVTASIISGTLRMSVRKDAAFDISARTISGNVTSDLDIAVSGALSGSVVGSDVSGKCNGGGNPVNLSATSGDIIITAQ